MDDEGHREEAEDEGPDDALSRFLRGDAMREGVPAKEAAEEKPSVVCLPRNAEQKSNVAWAREMVSL